MAGSTAERFSIVGDDEESSDLSSAAPTATRSVSRLWPIARVTLALALLFVALVHFGGHLYRGPLSMDVAALGSKSVGLVRSDELPSLMCFSVVIPGSVEVELVKLQRKLNASIFSCQAHILISNEPIPVDGVKTLLISSTAAMGVSRDGTSANTNIFIKAWGELIRNDYHKLVDWVVKADPDAVLLPDRLRWLLVPERQPGSPFPPPHEPLAPSAKFVVNCDVVPGWSDQWPMMYGASEVISRNALELYDSAVDMCLELLDWKVMGEDDFMGECLRHLRVGEIFIRVGQETCNGPQWGDCRDASFTTFHPYKTPDVWAKCWEQATG